MLWEHKLQGSVSTAFLSSPKLSQVFQSFTDRNMENMFSIYLREHCDEEMENNLLASINKMQILFALAIITSTAHASPVSPSSYRNAIFNQSEHIIS